MINCVHMQQKESDMHDNKVRTILNHVRGMSVEGKSPVDYIDGVLDTIPNDSTTTESACACKKPILGADYGPLDAKPCF